MLDWVVVVVSVTASVTFVADTPLVTQRLTMWRSSKAPPPHPPPPSTPGRRREEAITPH